MATKKGMSFEEAYKLPIGEFVEKKGQFSYLSWSHAVRFLRENYPDSTWYVNTLDGLPFFCTGNGCFVCVTVTHDMKCFTQWHPVLDHANRPIAEPSVFQINTAIQRCLAKAISISTGIGLGLYSGEDLPMEESAPPKSTKKPQKKQTPKKQPEEPAPPKSDSYLVLKEELDSCANVEEMEMWADANKEDINGLDEDEKTELRSQYSYMKKHL